MKQDNKKSGVVNINEVAQKKLAKLQFEKDSYKLAFETVMDYLKGYAKYNNDGSIILNLTFHACDLDEDDAVQLEAFSLIEEASMLNEIK